MEEDFQGLFIEKLEELYGPWEKSTSRFGAASYGKISKDLCISPSQFSKLIYGNATEGMYIRSIRNVGRLTEEQNALARYEHIVAKYANEQAHVQMLESEKRSVTSRIVFLSILCFVIGAAGMYLLTRQSVVPLLDNAGPSEHPLLPYFDQEFGAAFDSPFLSESDVQDYCPCSAYEGQWSMYKAFKLPLPGSRHPGLYYLAKQSDIRMKCSKIDEEHIGRGKALAGYEYLISEIWVDTKLTPLIPKYFNNATKSYTPEFDSLVFENNPQFKKVATLHAFNVNKFELHRDSIVRRAELTGRFASDVNEDLTLTYKIDLKHILENVLGNLTRTDCQSTLNPFCNPNDLKEGESVIAFDCIYTIQAENLGIGGGYPYTKGFRLEKQNYSDNLTCQCD